MFKTIVTATAIVGANAAINGEFLSGVQTGAFLSSLDQFEDHSCPEPEMSA